MPARIPRSRLAVAIGGSEAIAGAQLDEFHTFSQSVLGFADDAVAYHVTNIHGNREVLVRIPGGLGRYEGAFEFMVDEATKTFKHYYFNRGTF